MLLEITWPFRDYWIISLVYVGCKNVDIDSLNFDQ